MEFKTRIQFNLTPSYPFHFDGTFHKPSHFPNNLKLEEWESGKYWQTLRCGNELYGLKLESKGTAIKPKLLVSIFSKKALSKDKLLNLKGEIIWRFEVDKDLKEFNEMVKKDKIFSPIFKKWLGMRNTAQYSLYELLIIAIVLQNATVRRSQQMLDALLAKYGIKLKFDNIKLWAIWLPKALDKVSEQELRDLKVGYRAKFIKKLSQDFSAGKVDEYRLRKLSREETKKELMKLYGIGPETARILLFEIFHQDDVFDHISPWQQKIYSMLFYNKKLVSADKIRKDVQRNYGKYSMLATHYIWEDIFWRRKNEHIEWLEKEIRL